MAAHSKCVGLRWVGPEPDWSLNHGERPGVLHIPEKTEKQGPRAQASEQTEEPASHSSAQGCVPLAYTPGWVNTQPLASPKSQLWGLGRWRTEPLVTP